MPIEVVYTDNQFASILMNIADNLPTSYNNIPYYNCGYYTGTEWTFDCWNLIKSILWGWNADTTVGSYTYNPGLHGLLDYDGIQLLNQCSNVSYNFASLTFCEYLYLHDTIDHAGIYIGTIIRNGREYNVVEATPLWNNGVQYSYVDSNGIRYQYKNGSQAGVWTAHGMLPWIQYSGQPPTPQRRKGLPIWMMIRYHF
jgi:hypothetical protein